jgi:glycerol-3-phosphate dehydrogenase (NAD(P)+)
VSTITKVSVLGAGAWGSALAILFSQVSDVTLWARDESLVEEIAHKQVNPNFLPATVKFTSSVVPTSDLSHALKSELVVIATPVGALRQIIKSIKDLAPQGLLPSIIWTCKGFELESGLLPHQVVQSELGTSQSNVGALIGPSFAKEVALGLPTAITLATTNNAFAFKWINYWRDITNFRIYANSDIIGAEVGAGIKNIIAIATGIADGLNLGLNARAALITRSLNEIRELVLALGGQPETIYGLTGVGDLILTCTGELSRNRCVGLELACGRKLPEILNNLGHVAEGVYAAKAVYELANHLNIEMPIVGAVYSILYKNADLMTEVLSLLKREPKAEFRI